MIRPEESTNRLPSDDTAQGNYVIDFTFDPPTIQRKGNQLAVVTGNVMEWVENRQVAVQEDILKPTGLIYTITIALDGGPASGSQIDFPRMAGQGQTRFANNLQPQIMMDGGHDVLAIQLLGRTGNSIDPQVGRGLTFYRDPSSQAHISLTLGEDYDLHNIGYTLTGLDMALADSICVEDHRAGENTIGANSAGSNIIEPNNDVCGGSFIDRVTLLSGAWDESQITAYDEEQLIVRGNVIHARFVDQNKNGRPDKAEDRRLGVTSPRGNVTIFQADGIGSQLELRFDDMAVGVEDDADGFHDFDAVQQAIGLASGITFDLSKRPPPPTPTPDPRLTTLTGQIFADTNQNGLWDEGEESIPTAQVRLYPLSESIQHTHFITAALSVESTGKDNYRFEKVQGDAPYRLEVLVPVPPAADAVLNPIRFRRAITPSVIGPNSIDFGIWVSERAIVSEPEIEAELLLPDLQPLTRYTLSPSLPDTTRNEIEREYPGLAAWYLDTETQSGHVLLRFGTLAANIGQGPLHVVGGKVKADSQREYRPIYQRIYTANGRYVQRRAGNFVFHTEHEHVHMDAFEQYNLRRVGSDEIVAASSKVSFCLTDVLSPVAPDVAARARVATLPMGWNCGADEQSINAGYSDYYGPTLADQWIDVTHVPSGSYWLEVVVDPLNRLRESNEENNRIRIRIDLKNPLL